ncbi:MULTISPECIES: hypothetical protein [unclassified Arcicella]|jgi:cation transport ATPase|nr:MULTISPECIES: hypothetical protein [unclassified Arcicella]MCA6439178.1 hypothetical protein [Chitinophagaceae bacterium]MDR6822745.1 cation transport ATPase [Arcicella sp. BE139]MCA6447573.1 hypothetical protein [Chitinophagaceae bacterium]MDR6561511.1 cation transport ATPase [Arcicella sp. BE51]MDR6811394.1 cation transport ATPase [Arcicella sp. BE140]
MAIKKHISAIADDAYKSDTQFEVISFECALPDKKTVTDFTAALHAHSIHPIASSVLKFLPSITSSDYQVERFEELPGHGIKGFVNGHEVIIGNISLMNLYDFYYDESLNELQEPVIIVMIDDRYSGCFILLKISDD